MHAKTVTLGAFALLLNALTAQAFHVESGIACDSVGAACSYISDDSSAGGSATTVVNGFCASDKICASNGAQCSSDAECYNYCGTDGICGGAGAGCNTQTSFEPGQSGIACGGDFTCSANGEVGTCEASEAKIAAAGASAAARRFKRRLDDASYHARQVRSSDLRAARLASRKHL